MVATRRMRQSKIDFSKATPASKSSPVVKRTTRSSKDTNEVSKPICKSSPAQKSRTRISQPFMTKGKRQTSLWEISSSEDEDSESDIPVLKSSSTRKRKRAVIAIDSESSESESDNDSDSSSGSGVKVTVYHTPIKSAPKKPKTQEDEDLAADLDFLHSSPPSVVRRHKPESKITERQRELELLKKRRSQGVGPLDELPTRARRKTVIDDSDDDDSEDEPVTKPKRRPSIFPELEEDEDGSSDFEVADDNSVGLPDDELGLTARDIFIEDVDDEDFVVDDDADGLIGAPDDLDDIPIHLTSWATAKPKTLFKFAVEFFVQKKLNPAFNKDREIYALTFKKLNDEAMGLIGSKYISSVWNRDFNFSLNSRPNLRHSSLKDVGVVDALKNCEACNRSGHPATFQMQFLGDPYNMHTFEDVEQDTDDEENEVTRDYQGSVVPAEERVYYVGSHCHKNAFVAHTLKHWRYSLMIFVNEYLDSKSHLEPEKIVERDGWKVAQKRQYADAVVDNMLEDGTVEELYTSFKAEVDGARSVRNTFGSTGW